MDKAHLKQLLDAINDRICKEAERIKELMESATEFVDWTDTDNTKEYYEGMLEGLIDGNIIIRDIIVAELEK